MSGVLGMNYFIRQYTGIPYPDPNDANAVKNYAIPAWQQSLTTSILSAGNFFGAIIAGDVADFIGRRWTIISGCVIFTIGGILETASTGLGVMVAGRLVAGLGVGFISAIVILYMSVSGDEHTQRSFNITKWTAGNRSQESPRRHGCLLYTSPSPRDGLLSRMPSSA